MEVKFFAEPNLYVRISNKVIQRMSGLKGLQFDANGEYVTENPYIINAMKTQFKHEEVAEPLPFEEVVVEAKPKLIKKGAK